MYLLFPTPLYARVLHEGVGADLRVRWAFVQLSMCHALSGAPTCGLLGKLLALALTIKDLSTLQSGGVIPAHVDRPELCSS